jgi:hypothetical protein
MKKSTKTKKISTKTPSRWPSSSVARAYVEGAFNAEIIPSTGNGGKTFQMFVMMAGEYLEPSVEGLTVEQFEQILDLIHDMVLTDRIHSRRS